VSEIVDAVWLCDMYTVRLLLVVGDNNSPVLHHVELARTEMCARFCC
jgi:hypothetical protein